MNGSSSSLSGCFLRELYAGGILKYYLSLILRFGRYVEGGGEREGVWRQIDTICCVFNFGNMMP